MLTDPAAHGGDAGRSFSVDRAVAAGYGFSRSSRSRGDQYPGDGRIFHKLMTDVLGYPRYCAQGGDWGSAITSRLGEVHATASTGFIST